MNCPNCNTPNEPGNTFCENCGHSLAAPSQSPPAITGGQYLGIVTVRLVVAVLGVWIIRSLLSGLSFIEGLHIPDTSMTGVSIVNALAYLVIIILLVGYARDLGQLWPQAFPAYPELGSLLVALVYTGILAAIYAGMRPFLVEFLPDREVLLIIQVLLAFFVLIIVARAAFIAYQGLSPWLTRLVSGFKTPAPTTPLAKQVPDESKAD